MKRNNSDSYKLGLKEIISMGVGGMVGGGIFSVLGLSVALAGHAAPIAFALGGVIALLTGVSYARLGLIFRSDGGSFTYLERAFKNKNIAGIGGWMLLVGYIGTLALYSYTFGVYGTSMFGNNIHSNVIRHILETAIMLVFLGINLYGVKMAGKTEDIIVAVKVVILMLFAGIGIIHLKAANLLPLLNHGSIDVLKGSALIFVAYEGFELIPNAVNEMKSPNSDLRRGIIFSIAITIFIYVLVSLVAVANLTPEAISRSKEYALAAAAEPFLGRAGFMLIGLGALLSTSSAINATLFGTARLSMAMAKDRDLPKLFSFKERTKDIPWASLIIITSVTLIFVNLANLTVISSFASSTFLLIFTSVNLSALKLHKQIGSKPTLSILGVVLCILSWFVLIGYLWQIDYTNLIWIGAFYLSVIVSELLFSKRRILLKDLRLWKSEKTLKK